MIDSDNIHNTAKAAPNDIDRLRRQARQRFIGAGVLVLIAVIALPFVLDSKPRPVSPNMTIDIPKSIPPEPQLAPPQAMPVVASQPTPETPAPAASATAAAQEPAPTATTTAPAPTAAPATPTKPDDGTRAAALLDGQAPAAAGYAIQAGSYTDKAKLQEVEAKLDKAGLAHYTQSAISKNGTHHTRVRLGPFATQQEANAAAIKVNKLGIKTIVIKPS